MGQTPLRARRPEQKVERRRAILAGARTLLGQVPWSGLTMAGLAGRLGLAKGTPYLYFRSKEALFLEVLQGELAAFFDALEPALAAARPGPTGVAAALAAEVAARPLLRRLLSLLHGVLEENVGLAEVRAFKRALLALLERGAARLEAALPGLPPGGGATLLLRLHALVIGAQAMAEQAPAVRRVLAEPALRPLAVDFEPFLHSTLADLLAGMHRPRAGRTGAP